MNCLHKLRDPKNIYALEHLMVSFHLSFWITVFHSYYIYMFIRYVFQLVSSGWVFDSGSDKWIYSLNPSFPSTSHIHMLFSVGDYIKLWILGFIYSFPLNPQKKISWLKYKILWLQFVSNVRIPQKQNKITESPFSFAELYHSFSST